MGGDCEIGRPAERARLYVELTAQTQRALLVLVAAEMEAEPALRLLHHRCVDHCRPPLRARAPQLSMARLPTSPHDDRPERPSCGPSHVAKSGSTSGRQTTGTMFVGRPDREHNRRDTGHDAC